MDDLPLELIVHILQYLSKKERMQFSIVNKKFHEAVLSPSLWTEKGKYLEVPPNRVKSFRKFLKQLPWLRNLKLEFSVINRKMQRHRIDFRSVLKPLKNLECLSLQLHNFKPSVTYFPHSLKHISLFADGLFFEASYISDDLLRNLADSCPLLEYFEIESLSNDPFTRKALCYLLDKVKDSLQTLILHDHFDGDPVFGFIDCPPNVTTLCFQTFNISKTIFGKFIDIQNFEILQILALDKEFPLSNEDFNEKKLSIPNLQILYLNACYADFDVVLKFVKCCPSLKVLAWNEPNGYSNKVLSELEKISKEKSVKVYLNFNADQYHGIKPVHNFPPFPNKNFLCFDTFYKVFLNKHHFIINFFKGVIVPH